MKKYLLEIVVFICGAVVMILEMVGSRLLSPYMGTSIIVWTSLIGIILASLSVGYWWGGALSDRNPNAKIFSRIIFLAAVLIFIMNMGKAYLLSFIQEHVPDIRIGTVIAAILLFAPPSILLGMVSPYAVRLKMHDVSTSGSTVGRLYAISTIGSIFGTFLAGFFLISYFGSTDVIFFLSGVLLMTSLLVQWRSGLKTKMAVFLLILILPRFSAVAALQNPENRQGLIDVDTQYSRIWIYDSIDRESRRPLRSMSTDPRSAQSIMYLDVEGDLYSKYFEFFDVIGAIKANLEKALMIGGAAYVYPKHFLEMFPETKMDVVEIDPDLITLAKKYFKLRDDSRLTVYHEDGRSFLNKTQNKYDVIFGDAYKPNAGIPHQLTTREAVQKMHDVLTDDGVVLLNILSNEPPLQSDFIRAEYKTFKSIFPRAYIFKANPAKKIEDARQSIVLMAIKSNDPGFASPSDPVLAGYMDYLISDSLETDLPILTDEFAPVDRYTSYGK